jgi:hypothetical protein
MLKESELVVRQEDSLEVIEGWWGKVRKGKGLRAQMKQRMCGERIHVTIAPNFRRGQLDKEG